VVSRRGEIAKFGHRNQADVSSAQRQRGIVGDQFAHPSPVDVGEVFDAQLAVDDRTVERRLGRRAELPADQVGGLGDDQRSGDKWLGLVLEQCSAGLVCRIVAVGGRQQRTGVDEQHSVPTETLGEQLVGVDGGPA
jgi:hypothetical protein